MRHTAIAVLLALSLPGTAAAAQPTGDRYLWLEDVTGEKSLAWARARNAETTEGPRETDAFRALDARLLAILDSDARIPIVEKLGPWYYNFWRDAKNPRGLWRRTSLDEYRKEHPQWEIVIDLDALAAAEKENWVWHGADCLKPEYERCLVQLSRGGADADVVREFDLPSKTWVKDGFFLPEAKSSAGWLDRDTLYVGTDFGPGSMTTSGYPRVAKVWKRGTPLATAETVFEGQARTTCRSPRAATTRRGSSATSSSAASRSSRTRCSCAAAASS